MLHISVIVPVYNDAEGLATTARSLLAQDYPEDRYEILLVDNGSSDDTPRVAEELAKRHPGHVQALEEQEIQSSYAARNRGVAAARGEILCFIDADMPVPPGYLTAVARRFEEPETQYLGCTVKVASDVNSLASLLDRILGFPIEGYLSRLHYAPTCCLSVRASVIDAVGPFDAGLESGGDMEFGTRVHDHGLPQGLIDEVALVHPARTRIRALRDKRRRVARGHARMLERHPGRFEELAKTYRWRRRCRPPAVARLWKCARKRTVPISRWRTLGVALLHLYLDMVGTYEFHKRMRTGSS